MYLYITVPHLCNVVSLIYKHLRLISGVLAPVFRSYNLHASAQINGEISQGPGLPEEVCLTHSFEHVPFRMRLFAMHNAVP